MTNSNRTFGGCIRPVRCLPIVEAGKWLLAIAFCPLAFADARTDGSVGAVKSYSGLGLSFTIRETDGTVRGNNLFHSFSQFKILTGEVATFTTTTATLKNIITRVTGGEPSSIHGNLIVNGAASPDFYFINPAGVVFGAKAEINVPAGFHVSTSQRLKFSDGFAWETNVPSASSLTIASPEAFGFLGGTSQGSIVVNNLNSSGTVSSKPTLAMKSGKTLTFAANDISIDTATVSSTSGNLRFVAQGTTRGDVKIDSPTSIASSTQNQTTPGVIQINNEMGTIELTDVGDIITNADNNGNDAGRIELLAKNVRMSKGFEIHADTNAAGSAGIIDIKANSLIIDHTSGDRITGIFNDAKEKSKGSQNTGQIKIVANEISLIGKAQIESIAQSTQVNPKAAGTVDILANKLLIDGGKNIGISAVGIFGEVFSNGKPGLVKVVARDGITLRNQGQISTNVQNVKLGEHGTAGTVIVEANTIDIVGKGGGADDKTGISSSAKNDTLGNPGTVTVSASNWIHISNDGKIAIKSESTSAAATNQSTTLTVSAANIELNHGSMRSSVKGDDSGGDIVINTGNQLKLTNNSSISSEAVNGRGGHVVVNAGGSIRLKNSTITSSVNGATNGDGGEIDLTGNSLVLESGFIQANTSAPLRQGGPVNIKVRRLVANGGNVFIGGDKILTKKNDIVGFNVIQAAAPDGVGGKLLISNPDIDISGTLLGLALPAELGTLSQDLCDVGANSSFNLLGRTTPYPSSKDPISP